MTQATLAKTLRKYAYVVFAFAAIAVFLVAESPLHAMTQEDLRSIRNGSAWYDPSDLDCGDPGDGPANLTVGKNFSLGPINDGKTRRINLIKKLMADFGPLTAAQAAGVVGNFMAESGGQHLPPDINEGGTAGPPAFKGGYGWAQWTGGRQVAFIDFATNPAQSYMASKNEHANDAANYAWLANELTSSQKVTITELRKQSSPEDAAVSFEATFERAGVPALEKRKAGARQAFEEYSGGNSPSDSNPTSDGAVVQDCGENSGEAGIVGKYAFPLLGSKKVVLNPGMFHDGTADQGGHPYTAYDILANPGTPVAAFLGGVVTSISADKCPGRLIGIYNKESNMTVSYLHLAFEGHVAQGATVTAGQRIGRVGTGPNGCGTPHLHIDAATGTYRPGCKREACPAENAAKFRDIGPQLFQTFQALEDDASSQNQR